MNRFRSWALLLGVWTAFGLLLAGQQTIASTLRGAPVPWSTSFFQWMPVAWGWALATPALAWLARLGRASTQPRPATRGARA